MRIYNRYIITVAISLLLSTVILAALGVDSLGIYYTDYVIEVLIITELYRHFSPRARRALNVISIIFSGGFFLVMLAQIGMLVRD